jgi:arsenate-mycothiol transferase
MHETDKPSVLFVCVKNAGKSQMAAGLMRKIGGEDVEVYSAGTVPGDVLNSVSVQALEELGIDLNGESPKPIDAQLLRDVDVVVTLGREVQVESIAGTRFEIWNTDEPSERGIDGIDRMRWIRNDIAVRVVDLAERLKASGAAVRVEDNAEGD